MTDDRLVQVIKITGRRVIARKTYEVEPLQKIILKRILRNHEIGGHPVTAWQGVFNGHDSTIFIMDFDHDIGINVNTCYPSLTNLIEKIKTGRSYKNGWGWQDDPIEYYPEEIKYKYKDKSRKYKYDT